MKNYKGIVLHLFVKFHYQFSLQMIFCHLIRIFFNLLKRDDLQIEEIVIWDSLIKWGINQITELKNMNSNRDK